MRYILSAIIRGIIPFVILSSLAGIMKLQRLEDYQVKSTFFHEFNCDNSCCSLGYL